MTYIKFLEDKKLGRILNILNICLGSKIILRAWNKLTKLNKMKINMNTCKALKLGFT